MHTFSGNWRDVKLAAGIGLAAEAVIWVLNFEAGQKLDYDIPAWIEFAQMPGGPIALRFFSRAGLFPALLFAVLFQATLFSMLTLSAICIYRLIRHGRDCG